MAGQMRRSRSIAVVLIGLAVAGCSAIPVPSIARLPQAGPVQVVGAALGAVINHDLAGASAMVCPGSRREDGLPFDVGPIFLPLGSLGELRPAEAIALVAITPVNVWAEPEAIEDTFGFVVVTGGLDLQYNLPATREYAVRATGGSDPELVDRVMLVAGDGHLAVSINAHVPVVRRNGGWRICDGGGDPEG
jgi:hypothetical protein